MPRGGKRDGAGRPSKWASKVTFKDTKLIRVPKHLVQRLLNIAHKMDRGENIDYLYDLLVEENKNLNSQIDLLISRNKKLCKTLDELTNTNTKDLQLFIDLNSDNLSK